MLPPTVVGVRKLERFLLPHSKDRMILSSFVWVQYQRVTDRRTELPWLIQRSALQAMRPRCKNPQLNLHTAANVRPVADSVANGRAVMSFWSRLCLASDATST